MFYIVYCFFLKILIYSPSGVFQHSHPLDDEPLTKIAAVETEGQTKSSTNILLTILAVLLRSMIR